MGTVAPLPVGSSWTRVRTCEPCFDRQILNHWTTREVPYHSLIEPWSVVPALQQVPRQVVPILEKGKVCFISHLGKNLPSSLEANFSKHYPSLGHEYLPPL